MRTAWAGALAGLTLASTAWADVAGRVLELNGRPIAGAAVNAYARETEQEQGERHVAGRPRTPLASVSSGTDGSFRIELARPFAWVGASADGYAPVLEAALSDTPMTLTLRRAALRRGVITAAGKPVPHALVIETFVGGAERITRTSADGTYETLDPESAPGALAIWHPDYAPMSEGLWRKHDLDVALTRGTPLAGSVLDESQKPVAGATIWVDGRGPLGKSDAGGAFRVARAPEEWETVVARAARGIGTATRRTGALVIQLKEPRSVSGTVRDAGSGQPLAGAAVVASAEQGVFSVATDTDARGAYTIGGLPPGRYGVEVSRSGYGSGPANRAPATPIDLRQAASARFDVALSKLPQASGRVVDEERRPVAGALVTLGFKDTPHVYAQDPLGVMSSMAGETRSTRTGADGSFSLMLPAPAEQTDPMWMDRPLVVLKPGHAAARIALEPTATGAPLLVALARGVELAGRVATPEGAPIAGVAVTVAEDGAWGGTMIPIQLLLGHAKDEGWTVTDADGRFSLRVHATLHHLWFRKPGHAPTMVRGHDPRAGEPVDVVLEPAATVRGRVARADGRGVPNVRIEVQQDGGGITGAATTAEDGSFDVSDLAPGAYRLTASEETLGIAETRMLEAPATDVQLVLAPSGALRGRVVEAGTQQPVPRFRISLLAAGSAREVGAEDPGGAFSIADVPLGDVTLEVNAEGYAEKQLDSVVPGDGEVQELEIALERDAPIRGRVTAEAGSPIPQAYVSLVRRSADVGATTDEDGSYELTGIAPGEVRLRFQAEGFLAEDRRLDTRQATRLNVTLKRGLSLRGEVVRAGTLVPGAFVSARSNGRGASHQSGHTDEQGRFMLEGLLPGRYDLFANAQGKGSAKLEDVDVEHTGPVRLVLDQRPTAILTGRVVGLPPAGNVQFAMVTAAGEADESARAMVDASHRFRMEDAPVGRVQVRAHAVSPNGVRRTSRMLDVVVAAGSETDVVIEFPDDVVIRGLVVRDGAPVPYLEVGFRGSAEAGASARTDARGAYEVVGLEPGPHQVTVSGDDVSYSTDYLVTGSSQFDIDITGASVSGRVVHADGAAPIAGVEVSFFRADGSGNKAVSSATSNSSGSFSQRSLREGRYRLITSKPGFGQEQRELELAHGTSAEVVFELSPADGVSVSVVDARDGRPLDANVVVRDAAKRIVANRHSGADEDGVLNIALANGSYLLSTSASGYGTVTLPVTAPVQGLRVGLTPGGTLVLESSRDLRGRVRLVQPDGEEYVQCWCNGIAEIQLDGRRTRIENVTPGSYSVELVDANQPVGSRAAVIREGQTTTVALE